METAADYHRRRAERERSLATLSSNEVSRAAHEKLAKLHDFAALHGYIPFFVGD